MMEDDMIARTIEFIIQKRKEYAKSVVCFMETNLNAIWRSIGTHFRVKGSGTSGKKWAFGRDG